MRDFYAYQPEVMIDQHGNHMACIKKGSQIVASAAIPEEVINMGTSEEAEQALRSIATKLMETVQNMDVINGKVIDI